MNEIEKDVGDGVALATIKSKINSAKEEAVIQNSDNPPKVADQGTKFVIINMTITNITKAPFQFEAKDLLLIDDKDTKYTPYGETIGNIDDYLDYQTLSPNIPKTGVVVYQLPKVASSYSFIIAKGGTNDLYVFKLK